MVEQSTSPFTSYADVVRFVARKMNVDGWEGDCEYHPFSQEDVSKGFLELIIPVADSRARLLRGAAGNGPIFVFVYNRGTWSYYGEMHGATVTAETVEGNTEFVTYSHTSARAGVQRRYRLKGITYECVSEQEIVAR
jgi:hypothetical protein